LQIIGGLLLLWIGAQLLNEEEESEEDAKTHHNLYAAIRTILIADLVMSLDNVIGVAAAAKGNLLLLTIGLGLSIPLVIFGSSLMIGLMTRFPVIISLGAALIGWVAGETLISDVLVAHLISHLTWLHWIVPAACALLVLTSQRWIPLLKKPQEEMPAATVDDSLQK
jgi:predicted tellurium resistance membrane protein TerC